MGYPVSTVISDTSEGVDPETAPELTPAQDQASKPDSDEVAQAAAEASSSDNTTPDDASAAAAEVYCGAPSRTINMYNVVGAKIWWFKVGEHRCYNGSDVVSYDKEPDVDHKIYTWAQALGWTWEGIDISGTKEPSYYTLHGRKHGALQVWRKGQFKYAPIKINIGAQQKFPWIHLYIHGDCLTKASWGGK